MTNNMLKAVKRFNKRDTEKAVKIMVKAEKFIKE